MIFSSGSRRLSLISSLTLVSVVLSVKTFEWQLYRLLLRSVSWSLLSLRLRISISGVRRALDGPQVWLTSPLIGHHLMPGLTLNSIIKSFIVDWPKLVHDKFVPLWGSLRVSVAAVGSQTPLGLVVKWAQRRGDVAFKRLEVPRGTWLSIVTCLAITIDLHILSAARVL